MFQLGACSWKKSNSLWLVNHTRPEREREGEFLEDGEAIPEPEIWFHDILRADGTPYSEDEVNFIKQITSSR